MARHINQQNPDADKQVRLRFPRGVDQVSPETAVANGAARRIVNFDVHKGGVIDDAVFGVVVDGVVDRGVCRRRVQKRLEELKLEAQISPLPPVVLGGLLVVPQGLLATMSGRAIAEPAPPADTQASAARARACPTITCFMARADTARRCRRSSSRSPSCAASLRYASWMRAVVCSECSTRSPAMQRRARRWRSL